MTDEERTERTEGAVPDPDLAGTTGLGTGGTGSVSGTDAVAGRGYRTNGPEGEADDQPPPSMLTGSATGTGGLPATRPSGSDDAGADEGDEA